MRQEKIIKTVVQFCGETQPKSGIYKIVLQSKEIKGVVVLPGQFMFFQLENERNFFSWFFPVAIKNDDLIISFVKENGYKEFDKFLHSMHSSIVQNVFFQYNIGFSMVKGIQKYILIAENIGCSTILSFGASLSKITGIDVEVFLSFKHEKEVFGLEYWVDFGFYTKVTVESSNYYCQGNILEFLELSLLKKEKKTQVIACGSPPMLKNVLKICKKSYFK